MKHHTCDETRGSTQTSLDLDRLSQVFIDAFPVMNQQEQQLALGLYTLLAEGRPVHVERLSETTDMPVAGVTATLDKWPGVFYNDDQRIVGFWGIAVDKTQHRLDINGKTAYTWCAWDTLFIPELLNTTARIQSSCAFSGDDITLTISPQGVESLNTMEGAVSFLVPEKNDLKENITVSFCHYVHFFRSTKAGERWTAKNPGTFLLSLDAAFSVGKKVNAARYDQTLNPKD